MLITWHEGQRAKTVSQTLAADKDSKARRTAGYAAADFFLRPFGDDRGGNDQCAGKRPARIFLLSDNGRGLGDTGGRNYLLDAAP